MRPSNAMHSNMLHQDIKTRVYTPALGHQHAAKTPRDSSCSCSVKTQNPMVCPARNKNVVGIATWLPSGIVCGSKNIKANPQPCFYCG
mmetsp:Transcript_33484/g.51326  ORF Transcript_33484/g.51326 Transcript_33484/m.51326 type:complete len:88 (-) Transcript_33484:203-466(-)